MNRKTQNSLDRRQFATGAYAAVALASMPVATQAASPKGKRIGIVDDDLDNYHSQTYLKILRDELKDRGYEIVGVTALQAATGRQWAGTHEVMYFDSVEELNERVDCFAVLAPGTPQTHLELCQAVFPFGKTTFVDKTFAPNAATAEAIFALADKHSVAIESSSALRYTDVQKYVSEQGGDKPQHTTSWGGGSSFDEYAIHPLELVVSCMGPEVETVMRRGNETCSQLLLNFTEGRTATVNVCPGTSTPFAAAITNRKQTRYVPVDDKTLFVNALSNMLDFFDAGEPLIDRRETMAIMRVLDAVRDPRSREKFVVIEHITGREFRFPFGR